MASITTWFNSWLLRESISVRGCFNADCCTRTWAFIALRSCLSALEGQPTSWAGGVALAGALVCGLTGMSGMRYRTFPAYTL
jgi:hypothetical protein